MEYGNGERNQLVWRSPENRYHNEDFCVDRNNQNVNVAMLAKKVQAGSRILDVGCGEGKFGAMLQGENCYLVGVDIDTLACKNAIEKYNYSHVYCFNVEEPEQDRKEYEEFCLKEQKFDYIALIDILEHVINPTRVVENVIKHLNKRGKILVSVPNVNNADIMANLLRDRFNYREAGVLDNTHTKYFTKRSFVEWIDDINTDSEFMLDCEYIGSTFGYTHYMEELENEAPQVYNFLQLNPSFNAIQHLFVLTYNDRLDKNGDAHLKKLLNEESVDLTGILNQIIDFSKINNSEKKIRAYILPNERAILKEEIQSAEQGWQECSEALKQAKIFGDKNARDIAILKDEIAQFQNERDQIYQKWKETAEALDVAKTGWSKCNNELEINQKGWRECAKALEDAKKGWFECAQALEDAKRGWKECARALEEVKSVNIKTLNEQI